MGKIMTKSSYLDNFDISKYNKLETLSEKFADSSFVPKEFRNKPNDIFVAMCKGDELGLAPLASLEAIRLINDKPCIYGDAAMALVLNSPKCEFVHETFDEITMTATCRAKREGHPEKVYTFSKEDAIKAKLWEKKEFSPRLGKWLDSPWVNYPKRMLIFRARGYALRDKFADVLKGLIIYEEAIDYPNENKEIFGIEKHYTPKIAAIEENKSEKITLEKFSSKPAEKPLQRPIPVPKVEKPIKFVPLADDPILETLDKPVETETELFYIDDKYLDFEQVDQDLRDRILRIKSQTDLDSVKDFMKNNIDEFKKFKKLYPMHSEVISSLLSEVRDKIINTKTEE